VSNLARTGQVDGWCSLLGDCIDGAEDTPSQNCLVFLQSEEDLKKVIEEDIALLGLVAGGKSGLMGIALSNGHLLYPLPLGTSFAHLPTLAQGIAQPIIIALLHSLLHSLTAQLITLHNCTAHHTARLHSLLHSPVA